MGRNLHVTQQINIPNAALKLQQVAGQRFRSRLKLKFPIGFSNELPFGQSGVGAGED
jgi:hypothetical protein